MRCKVCNAYIPQGAGRCLECGAELEPETVCQRCGAMAGPSARFCRKCGAPMVPPPQASSDSQISHQINQAAKFRACNRCGSNIPEGIKYCMKCGTSQDSVYPSGQSVPSDLTDSAVSNMTASDPDKSRCPACGTEARGAGRFCFVCGRFIGSELMTCVCPACGANSSIKYSRCQYCGGDFSTVPEALL
jgi:ribosomal protein L40E